MKLYNYKEASEILSVSVPYLRILVDEGKIPYTLLPKRGSRRTVRFSESNLKEFVERGYNFSEEENGNQES